MCLSLVRIAVHSNVPCLGSIDWNKLPKNVNKAVVQDRAVSCQSTDHYEELGGHFKGSMAAFMATQYTSGFGENMLVSGLSCDTVCVGDRFNLVSPNGGPVEHNDYNQNDLSRTPYCYVLYGAKYIGLVSLFTPVGHKLYKIENGAKTGFHTPKAVTYHEPTVM